MKKIILTSLNTDELKELVSAQIQSGINKSQRLKNEIGSSGTTLKYFSIVEVIAMLGVCRTTLHNWRRQGEITYKKIGRRIYFTENDINMALKSIDLSKLQDMATRLGGKNE